MTKKSVTFGDPYKRVFYQDMFQRGLNKTSKEQNQNNN